MFRSGTRRRKMRTEKKNGSGVNISQGVFSPRASKVSRTGIVKRLGGSED